MNIPVDRNYLDSKLATKGRRNYFTCNMNITSAEGRLVWTPEMGRDNTGPVVSDPAYNRLLSRAWQLNNASDAAELYGADVMFRQAAQLTTLYGRLYNDTPVDADTESDLTGEPSGNGYAAVSWSCNSTDFPTLSLVDGNGTLVALPRQFTASGGSIGPVTYLVMQENETATTGDIYIYIPLEGSTTILAGESFTVTPAITMS